MVSQYSEPESTAAVRVVIVHVKDAPTGAAQFQVYQGVTVGEENATYAQHYGFASNPPKNTEGVAVESGGQLVSVAENVGSRPDLPEKHAALYDSAGNWIKLKDDDGGIELNARLGQKVTTLSATLLGSLSAAQAILKGTQVHGDFATLFASWQTALTPLKAHVDPVIQAYANAVSAAIGITQTAMTNWQSTKHKVDS